MGKKKRKKTFTPLTKHTWVKKFKEEFEADTSILTGYIECVVRQTPVLVNMAKKARTLEEMQDLVIGFAQQQSDVLVDISNAWGSTNADKYGFSDADAIVGGRFAKDSYKQLDFRK